MLWNQIDENLLKTLFKLRSFAASLFDRITEMIEDIQSPLNRKMKLVPLLVHMHHDTSLSAKVRNLLNTKKLLINNIQLNYLLLILLIIKGEEFVPSYVFLVPTKRHFKDNLKYIDKDRMQESYKCRRDG